MHTTTRRPRFAPAKRGFTLVEIMIVVLIIGILLAIAIPNFVGAREASRTKSCVGNLQRIISAKQQCAMDNKIAGSAPDTFNVTTDASGTASTASPWSLVDTSGKSGYLRNIPTCPSGGQYAAGLLTVDPACNFIGATGSGYAKGEKLYHGLN